jgi:phage-related holin
VVAKAFDESRDCFVMSDSWDLETHIREASDVVAQWLACSVTYALEVVLVARLVTCGDEIVDEGLPKVRPGIELVLREAEKPLMTCLIKNNWKIVSHYVLITYDRLDGDLVERDPAFGVLLAVIFLELLKLEIPWPNDLSEMRSKLFETRGAVFGVILDAAHVLMGLTVISTTSDVTTDIARRKMAMEIARRVLVDLLISIAVTIAVVVAMTSTTFLSALVTAATTVIAATATATTTGRIVAMLATWML